MTPASATGCILATGVMLPIFFPPGILPPKFEVACLALNLKAMAHLGWWAVEPHTRPGGVVIDLDHHAIDFICIVVSFSCHARQKLMTSSVPLHFFLFMWNFKSQRAELVDVVKMGIKLLKHIVAICICGISRLKDESFYVPFVWSPWDLWFLTRLLQHCVDWQKHLTFVFPGSIDGFKVFGDERLPSQLNPGHAECRKGHVGEHFAGTLMFWVISSPSKPLPSVVALTSTSFS